MFYSLKISFRICSFYQTTQYRLACRGKQYRNPEHFLIRFQRIDYRPQEAGWQHLNLIQNKN